MTIIISGKHIELGDSLKKTIQSNIEQVVSRYLETPLDATVTVAKDANHLFKTEIQVHVRKGFDVHCVGVDEDPYKSADQSTEKLEKQLRRYKTRLLEKRRKKDDHEHVAERVQKFIIAAQHEDTHDDNPLIIAEMESEIHTLSVGDAVMKMDLSPHPALVFKNSSNGQINVVFRRSDGNIGWIDPSLKVSS